MHKKKLSQTFATLLLLLPLPRYAELDEAFRRQYARSVTKPMDLRTVRDRLLGRVKAGDAAKASQAFFLRGELDSFHNPQGKQTL